MLRRIFLSILLMCFLSVAREQELDPAARWATIAFSEYQVLPEMVYKTVGGHSVKLDVLTAGPLSETRPTVIFIHGGAWGGGKEVHALFPLPYLARGMNVVNIAYRVTSIALAPAAVEDCRCALYWVFRHAKQYGFDTSKLVVAGESAGGHLSLMTGLLDPRDGFDNECGELEGGATPRVTAIVEYCGITDVADLLEGPHHQSFAVGWLGNQPNRAELARRVSPLTYVRRGSPPVIIVHGDADKGVPYEQGVRLHAALDQAGVANEFMTIPGGRHWFWPREQFLVAQQAVFKFLEQHGILTR
jgi:acetyl esterase/lipase